jgi:hypothetical protein
MVHLHLNKFLLYHLDVEQTDQLLEIGSAAVSPSVKKANSFNFESINKVELPEDDCVKSYAVEDTPYNISMPTSPKHEITSEKTKREEIHSEKLKMLADVDKMSADDVLTNF